MAERGTTDVRGRIFDIQRFSVHDGPGIRTTVFLMGCPLRCLWCHNPEGVDHRPILSFDSEKCIGCGYCSRVCPRGAHQFDDSGGHVLDRSVCQACGPCARECYAGGLELIGREASVSEVMGEVLRDEVFYRSSGGGVTISGGEPLLQVDFCESLLSSARAAGVHCAVETSGHVGWASVQRLVPHVDLFLYDIKETDEARHMQYTGVSGKPSLENLRALHGQGAAILLRLPIVPGLNDRPDHFAAVGELVRSLPELLGVQIMPYHPLGLGKHARLGTVPGMAAVATPDGATVEGWRRALRAHGIDAT